MRRLLQLVFVLLLLPLLGRAQETRITGRVVDAKTKLPVPFASLGLRETDTGALSNEEGYFQMKAVLKSQQDSLICMTLGYGRNSVLIKDGQTDAVQIEMEPRPFSHTIKTGPCGVVNKSKQATLSHTEKMDEAPGRQYAFYIKNEKGSQLGRMRSVSLYLGEDRFPSAEFRIRIYTYDGLNKPPGKDILTENVVFTPRILSGWYTRNLLEFNIEFPENGCFIALEFGMMDGPYGLHPYAGNDTIIGEILRPSLNNESNVWSYGKDEGWKLCQPFNDVRKYRELVKLELGR